MLPIVQLHAGTVLFHGTAHKFDCLPTPPAWWSDGPEIASGFGFRSSMQAKSSTYRIIAATVTEEINVIGLKIEEEELHDFVIDAKVRRGSELAQLMRLVGFVPRKNEMNNQVGLSKKVCAAGFDGWVIPNVFEVEDWRFSEKKQRFLRHKGKSSYESDIMLCRDVSLDIVRVFKIPSPENRAKWSEALQEFANEAKLLVKRGAVA